MPGVASTPLRREDPIVDQADGDDRRRGLAQRVDLHGVANGDIALQRETSARVVPTSNEVSVVTLTLTVCPASGALLAVTVSPSPRRRRRPSRRSASDRASPVEVPEPESPLSLVGAGPASESAAARIGVVSSVVVAMLTRSPTATLLERERVIEPPSSASKRVSRAHRAVTTVPASEPFSTLTVSVEVGAVHALHGAAEADQRFRRPDRHPKSGSRRESRARRSDQPSRRR